MNKNRLYISKSVEWKNYLQLFIAGSKKERKIKQQKSSNIRYRRIRKRKIKKIVCSFLFYLY